VKVAVLVLRERFRVIPVKAIVTLVQQGRFQLEDPCSAPYAQRVRKLTQMQQHVNTAPRECFNPKVAKLFVLLVLREALSPKLVRQLVVLVLREPFSPNGVRRLAILVLREAFNLKLVNRLAILVLREPFSPNLVRRLVVLVLWEAFSPKVVRQLVSYAQQEAINPKLVRHRVRSALKELTSPPVGNLHVSHAQPEKSACLGLQNAFHARKGHFLMKPLEVVSHVTTTYLGTKENATARWISELVLTMQKLANANLILKTNLLNYYQDVNVLNSRVML